MKFERAMPVAVLIHSIACVIRTRDSGPQLPHKITSATRFCWNEATPTVNRRPVPDLNIHVLNQLICGEVAG